jgi:hypothetical protein
MALPRTQRPKSPERPDTPLLVLQARDLAGICPPSEEALSTGVFGLLGDSREGQHAGVLPSPMGFDFELATEHELPKPGLALPEHEGGAGEVSVPSGVDLGPWRLPENTLYVTVHHGYNPAAIARAESQRRRLGMMRTVQASLDDSEVTVIVGATGADIFASEAEWATLSEPVLLVVAQFVRYCLVERRFEALQRQARRDHSHAVRSNLRSLRERKRLECMAHEVRSAVSDWVYWSGPSADPARSCSSESAREVYEQLADELGIEVWSKGISDLVVDVEQTYESLSDKLFHYRQFMLGMVVEFVIIGLIAGLLVH